MDNAADDVLTLTIGTTSFSGWSAIEVTRSLEMFPSHFRIAMTEHNPSNATTQPSLFFEPGVMCTISLGRDRVLSGWIDDYTIAVEPDSHTITLSGRSLCADAHDCTAFISNSNQINYTNLPALATALLAPFNIPVVSLSPDPGPPIPQLSVNFGESAFAIIERVARWVSIAWLIFDNSEGAMVLSPVGTTEMASGIAEGIPSQTGRSSGGNVQRATVSYSKADRFSDYYVVWTSADLYADTAAATNSATAFFHGTAKDDGVGRHRPLGIVSEQVTDIFGVDQSEKRALWERNRRYGRSQVVNVTVDSWRDVAGHLWEINKLVNLDLPTLKVVNVKWLIVGVTFRRDEGGGTTCDLTLMDPLAMSVQPTALSSFAPDLNHALNNGSGVTAPGKDTYVPGGASGGGLR